MGLSLIAVACLVGAAFAGPFQRESESRCATECPRSSHERFDYKPGNKYVYDYSGVNYLTIAGRRMQKALITGKAEYYWNTRCDVVLKLRNIRLDHKASEEETSRLIRQLEIPMSFSFQDGKIEHVCPNKQESKQSLNIKKGILSAGINTMKRFDVPEMVKEVDSLGTCMTKYKVISKEDKIVEKTKDLKSCTNRHTSVTSLITNPYDAEDSNIHTLPIFPEERLTCEQRIENHIYKYVKCTERATLKPFKEQDSIIEFEGELELRLRSVEKSGDIPMQSTEVHSPEAILYNLEEEYGVKGYEKKVEDLLKKMCEKNRGFIDATISRDFFDLVSYSKHLPYESLDKIYRSLENGQICSTKKILDVFVDALPMAGSEGAIKLMVRLLVDNKIVGLKAKLWTVSLAFIRRPTDKALVAVVDLLKQDKSASVLLGVSAMVSRFCKISQCEKSEAVRQIISELNQVIGNRCSYDDEKKLIAVLKAFGNMGYLGEAQSNILSCGKPSVQSVPVRLAAIDAFRGTEKRRPKEMLNWYTNTEEHYEIRIAALSSIIKHANMEQIQAIKRVAEMEKHDQVAAYTATLIANMKKSSSPLKKPVRNLLRNVEFKTPNVSYWDNSKNIELSTFSEALNVGGGFEADLVHNPQSKIPRSVYTRFDVDVLGTRMNIFEMGIRADGLEELIKKALLQQVTPQQKSSWNFLRSSKPKDQLEASIFLRTMGIEFFELSASDLTGLGQMLKVADVMNKISRERSADFSHSFLFMNSKLVIPSVTGRSYSFGLTGSATVGLTASNKIDVVSLLSSPRNGDIHGRFKPSCNVEMSATVGIQSNTGRPDMKIVTVLHSESDIEARFQVKDGHMALASITLPSDEVIVAKVSSNVIEIGADHSEKPVFGTMQKKIDTCITQLEKPLGLSVCGKWEIPRPFLNKKFPYISGIGNIELSMKKTDPEMTGYELKAELPRRASDVMKYEIVLDTPHSRVLRRFSSELEVRKVAQGKKEFTMDLKSPFKSASAAGSWTIRRDLIEGQIEMTCGSKRASFNASTQISDSDSLKIFKPSVELTMSRSRPIKIGGIISISKGQKQQISVDIKSNVPQRKPLSIKGILIKEGEVRFTKDSEWKLSSDIAIKSPLINAQLRSSTEKQAKQAQTLFSDIKIDYQTERSEMNTLKWSEKFQQSASKISYSSDFEMTQIPSAKWSLTWNMQGKIRESLKNDITLKYGRQMEKNYINVLHSSQLPERGLGECKVAVKAPQWNVDSELRVSHEVQKGSKLFVEADVRYRQDKHVKGLISWEKPSEKPLKMKIKSKIELPNRRQFSYEDELEEVSPNTFEGTTRVQWQSDKRAELKYKYQKQAEQSSIKHELETTLRLPSLQSPIKSRVSVQLGEENASLESRLNLDRSTEYFIKAHLNKKGASHLSVKVPKIEGNLKVIRESNRKAVNLDVKLNLRRPRHIIASGDLSLGSQKKIEAQIQWDADRKADNKIAFSTLIEDNLIGSKSSYSFTSKLMVARFLTAEVTGSGDRTMIGRHEASLDVTVLSRKPIGVVFRYDMDHESIKSSIKFSKSHSDKAEISAEARLKKNANDIHLTTRAAIKSLDNSFESKEWSSEESLTRSDKSITLKSHVRLQWSSNKVYESELNYDLQPRLVSMKAFLHTPHIKFEKQAIGFSLRRTGDIIASSATLELSNGKVISVSQEIKIQKDHFSHTITVSSPFKKVKDVKFHLAFDNDVSKKSLLSYVDFNGMRKADAEANMEISGKNIEVHGRFKSVWYEEVSVHLTSQRSSDSFKYAADIMKGPSSLLSTSASKHTSNQQQLYAIRANSLEKNLVDLKLSKESSQESTKHMLEASGPFAPVSVAVEAVHDDVDALKFTFKACQESGHKVCYHIKGYHKSTLNTDIREYYRKITLDVEKSQGKSQPTHLSNIALILSIGKNDFRQKVMVTLNKQKTYGYEITAHHREHDKEPCHIDVNVYLAKRAIRARGSVLHNRDGIVMEIEVLPDASAPKRRLALELKQENFPQTKEIAGYVHLIYPGMEKHLELSGRIQTEGKLPMKGKLELHYSPSSYEKSLTLEIVPQTEGRQAERKAFVYKLYREDKSLDASVKLIKKSSRSEDFYGYEYSLKTSKGELSGGVSLTLAEKRNGKPTSLEIAFTAPDVDFKVKGRSVWSSNEPNQVGLIISSKGQKVYEFTIRAEDSCIVIEEGIKGTIVFKTLLCANKVENGVLKVFYIESFHKTHKCLDFSINVDPKQSNIATIVVDWDKKEFRHAWEEMKGLEELVMNSPLRDLVKEIKMDIKHMHDTLKPIYEKVKRKISNLLREQILLLKNLRHKELKSLPNEFWTIIMRLMPFEFIKREVVRPILEMTACMVHKYVNFAYEHIPDIVRIFMEETKEQLSDCAKKICSPGTFCYALMESYHRGGMNEWCAVVQEKIKEIHSSWPECQKWISDIRRLIPFDRNVLPDFRRLLHDILKLVKIVKILLPDFSPYFEGLRHVVEDIKEAISQVKNKIHDLLDDVRHLLDPSWWRRKSLELVRNECRRIVKTISESELYQRVMVLVDKLRKRAQVQLIHSIDKLIEKVNELIKRSDSAEDVKVLKAILVQLKDGVQDAWENKEAFVKKTLEPLRQTLFEEYPRKWISERFTVQNFSPKEGSIQVQVHYPYQNKHIQVLSNVLRIIKSKIVN